MMRPCFGRIQLAISRYHHFIQKRIDSTITWHACLEKGTCGHPQHYIMETKVHPGQGQVGEHLSIPGRGEEGLRPEMWDMIIDNTSQDITVMLF